MYRIYRPPKMDKDTLLCVLDFVETTPLGYMTEREHEVLESYADTLVKWLENEIRLVDDPPVVPVIRVPKRGE